MRENEARKKKEMQQCNFTGQYDTNYNTIKH